jgi:rod shape-determining protein MreC
LVAFRTAETRPILARGPSTGLRFFFFALLSLGLMWLDQRGGYLDTVRHALSLVTYPLQLLVDSPGAAWDWLQDSFATRDRLRRENEELETRLRQSDLRLMRFADLEQENLRLRGMRAATARISERVVVAEIMHVDLNPYRHRVIINKGTRDGAFKGQAVLDATGVFGQITHAGPFSSEAILITDAEHAIPVQVNRNGLRSLAVGTGDLHRLSLPFLPTNADIRVGDLLVTSGLDDVFPAGYPVGKVTKAEMMAAQTLANVVAEPAATLDRDREVLLVWLTKRPAAEIAPEAADPPAQARKP